MNVELVIPTPSLPCGVLEYTADLAAALKMQTVEAHICSGTAARIAAYLHTAHGLDVLHLQFGYYLYPPAFLADLLALAGLRHWPVVVTMHGFRREYGEHHRLLRQVTLVVHSHRMAGGLIRAGFDPMRVNVLEMPCPTVVPARPVHPSRIGYFGFLLPHKGLLQLIQAASILSERHPSLETAVLSAQAPFDVSHAYRRLVGQAMADPRLAGRVNWSTGFISRDSALAQLAGCAMIVLPYSEHREIGVSAAARLALAAGRPLVTTEASFFDGLETEAFRIASPSAEAIAGAISRLLNAPPLLRDYASRAAAHARLHTWPSFAAKLIRVYRHTAPGSISSSAKSFLK